VVSVRVSKTDSAAAASTCDSRPGEGENAAILILPPIQPPAHHHRPATIRAPCRPIRAASLTPPSSASSAPRNSRAAPRDICPHTGRARLGYDRCRVLLDHYAGLELHQLRHSAATTSATPKSRSSSSWPRPAEEPPHRHALHQTRRRSGRGHRHPRPIPQALRAFPACTLYISAGQRLLRWIRASTTRTLHR
jgi:hypothetical protein